MQAGETFALLAPLSGPVVPIDAVPDAVFAERMVGDGISIDPTTQTLLAPCDGVVTQLHASRHAITLKTPAGVELLMHIGLDTVRLKGKGFTARVSDGEQVVAGQPLIDFDADYVLNNASSLLTQIVITNGEAVRILERASGFAKAGESDLLLVQLRRASPAGSGGSSKRPGEDGNSSNKKSGASGKEEAASVVVPNPNGLHARPAAVLVNEAKRFAADIDLELAGARANAKSLVALLSLGVGARATVRVVARGGDAAAAVARIVELLQSGLGEDLSAAPLVATAAPQSAARDDTNKGDERHLFGANAAPGLAIAPVFKLDVLAVEIAEDGGGAEVELPRLREAIAGSRRDLEKAITRSGARTEQGKIFGAHLTLLDDPETFGRAESAIREGKSAAFAWREATKWGVQALSALANPLLAARASDLRDVGGRVLLHLTGGEEMAVPADSIVIAESLTPSDVVRLAEQKAKGFVTVLGGTTSHVAILARSLGLPCLIGVPPSLLTLVAGQMAVLDAEASLLLLDPTAAELATYGQALEARQALRASQEAASKESATTRDGVHVEVLANIANAEDAVEAVRLGADGVGLLRTEFMFLERDAPPTEAEQVAAYDAIGAALGKRPLIIRTLDVGGDKPLSYMPLPPEDNPLLGIRGLRLGWLQPELVRAQLRAILSSKGEGRRRIMLPMVSSIEEFREAKQMLKEERQRASAPPLDLGIMVEVPSAAIQADSFAAEVDFFSIGTNDLAQYTLAMDRTHPRLASRQDGLHPAVLRLIESTVRAARKHGKPVGVCGALASDLDAVAVLIGLGVTDLSVSVHAIPEVKAKIRGLNVAHCREIAKAALDLGNAIEVRALLAAGPGRSPARAGRSDLTASA